MRTPVVLLFSFVLLVSVFPLISFQQSFAQTDTFGASQEQIISSVYSDPVFLDAFWTNSITSDAANASKVEAGPGDGTSRLAVVLVNRGISDITNIAGSLDLPSGFRASGKSQSAPATATFNSIVTRGQTFTLIFEVDIQDTATMGAKNANLSLEYSRTRETGAPRTAEITVPFRLTGTVILDAMPDTKEITPGVPSPVNITLVNRGTAGASDVMVTVGGISGSTNGDGEEISSSASVGAGTFKLGSIAANSTVTITPVIFVTTSAGETVQQMELEISYRDSYGNQENQVSSVGVVVSPRPAESPLSIEADQSRLSLLAGRIENLNFTLVNNGESPVTEIVVLLEPDQDDLRILGNSKWVIDEMGPNSIQEFGTRVFASESLIGSPASFSVNLQYISSGQGKNESLTLGNFVDGVISLTLLGEDGQDAGIRVSQIREEPFLTGTILNDGNSDALFVKVTASGSDMQAQSTYLGNIEPDSPVPFNLPIRGDGSGNEDVEVTIEYQDLLGQVHVENYNATVDFDSINQANAESEDQQSTQAAAAMIPIVAIAAVLAGVGIYIFKRRKKKQA